MSCKHKCDQLNCKHEEVKFCEHCQRVYCEQCGREWPEREDVNQWPQAWYYPPNMYLSGTYPWYVCPGTTWTNKGDQTISVDADSVITVLNDGDIEVTNATPTLQ